MHDRVRPDCAYIHRELKRNGVTLQLLWEEYARVHPNSYRRTSSPDLAFNFTGMRSMTLEPRSPGAGGCIPTFAIAACHWLSRQGESPNPRK